MNKEIKTPEDLENYCNKNTGHSMNVPPFVYIDKYFEDIEKAYGNGYRAGYKEACKNLCLMESKADGGDVE